MKFRRPSPRTWLKIFALLCAIWCFWHPRRMDALFSSIPFEATAVSYHNGLTGEWKALSRSETFVEILEQVGIPDAREIVAEPGIYQTMFWLTGRDTVVGYVPHTWSGSFDDAHLVGASYVGWKAKFMELLWLVKWIPGLGRMESTPTGTRFMRFKGLVDSHGRDLLLGLDIVDGMLLATLSTNPETVRQLADRVVIGVRDDFLATAFAGARPWKTDFDGSSHVVWITDSRFADGVPTMLTISSLRAPGIHLALRGKLNDLAFTGLHRFEEFADSPPPGADVAAASVPLLVVFDAAVVERLGPLAPPVGRGLAAAYLSGKPNEGRLMGLAYPAFNAALPWKPDEDFKAWSGNWVETARREAQDAKLRTDWAESADAKTRFVFSSHLEFLGRTKPGDMAFLELRDKAWLHIGSHYGSFRGCRAVDTRADVPTIGTIATTWQNAHPAAFAAGHADMVALHDELRRLGAIAKLAGSLVGGADAAARVDGVKIAERILGAMVPLGVVEFAAFAESDGWVKFDVRTQGAAAH